MPSGTAEVAPPVWPRVWVLDRDQALCAGLTCVLRQMAIDVRAFDDAGALLEPLERDQPNCLVLGFGDGERLGLELLARSGRGERLSIVLVSRGADVASTVRAMKDGAVDVLERPADLEVLAAAVVRGIALDAEWREVRRTVAEAARLLEGLTTREREVFDLLAAGKPNKLIAAELGISEKTIKVHRGRVMHKLRATSVVDLVHLFDWCTSSTATRGARLLRWRESSPGRVSRPAGSDPSPRSAVR
ncbi:MAG: DNA-binding response regulator [Myxococcaceae bacterium]|nr:MAG: DNA-binding response regulator [Myxococcaceae bacterium]